MKVVIGQPARAENFLHRETEMRRIEEAISSGFNIQIAAPRRVGKTSLLFYYYDNPPENRHMVFVDTESVDSVNQYYRKIYEKIIQHKDVSQSPTIMDQIAKAGNAFLKKVKTISVPGVGGIEFNGDNDIDYLQEFTNFFKGIDLNGSKVVLMIDEFPEAILNILEKSGSGESEAIRLLQTNRELRMDPDIGSKLQFVYTGSISLNLTVSKFNATRFINDLRSISVNPLTSSEAETLITSIIKTRGHMITPEVVTYFIDKIHWPIVSQVQMIIDEIINLLSTGRELTIETVDEAFDKLLGLEYKNYFNHYVSRLSKAYDSNEYVFAFEMLKSCVLDDEFNKNKVRDLASKHDVLATYKHIVDNLIYDGYVDLHADSGFYKFNSPILRLWWLKHVIDEQ